METNLKSQATIPSTQFSIFDIPNVEETVAWLRTGKFQKLGKTYYQIGNNYFNEKICFGDLAIDLRYKPEATTFTWKVRCFNYFKSIHTQQILNSYLNWIKSHPTWVEGIQFKMDTDHNLFITFPVVIPKLKFHFLVMLFRRIEWYPTTVLSWYIVEHLNLKFDELQRLLLSTFVTFQEYEQNKNTKFPLVGERTFGFGQPDPGHFLIGATAALKLWNTNIPDPAKDNFSEKHLLGKSNSYATTLWFGEGVVYKAEQSVVLSLEFPYVRRCTYEQISSNW